MSPLLLDACSLINLVASGLDLRRVAQATEHRFLVTATAAAEALYLAPRTPEQGREPIVVAALVSDGIIELIELEDEEIATFVALARDVDDGEASSLAIARHRVVHVATDDRKAQRLAAELGVAVVTTAGLLRRWAEIESSSSASLSDALSAIELRANFTPRRDDVDRSWWDAAAGR